jgi:hypothetical protein
VSRVTNNPCAHKEIHIMAIQNRNILGPSIPSPSSGDGASGDAAPSARQSTASPDAEYSALTARYDQVRSDVGGGDDHTDVTSARDGQHPGDLRGDEGRTGAGKVIG